MVFPFSVGKTVKLRCFYALFYADAQARTAKNIGRSSRREDHFIG